jgi:hypothetical protein
MSGENIRIDYGAADCYYLATKSTCLVELGVEMEDLEDE